jgi:hypothetical protein
MKLWFASKAGNWDLVGYEAAHIAVDLANAAMTYNQIPVELIGQISGPLRDIQAAARGKSLSRFLSAYSEFTSACNSCHAAGGVAFIRIQTPVASPFGNQSFSASGKSK